MGNISLNLLYRYITQGRVEADRPALSPRVYPVVFIDALVMKIRQRQVATGIVLADTDVNNETHEIAQPSRHLARSADTATP